MMLREKIKKLHNEGKSYVEISKLLKCSKGVISYHCNASVKRKSLENTYKHRENVLYNKLRTFTHRSKASRKVYGTPIRNPNLTEENLRNKYGETPKCYLTGDTINLDNPEEYSLDHITPFSKGGGNSLENCGLATSIANRSKTDMSYDEFVVFCKKVVDNYENTKRN